MTKATNPTDERLFGLLRQVRPLSDSDRSGIEADAGGIDASRLLERILSSERHHAPRRFRLRISRRRRLVLSAVSACSLAVATAGAIVVFTAGNAPSIAFAGWSAEPTAPATGQVQSAETECQRSSKLTSHTAALTDVRGPYTLLVFAGSVGSLCVTGPSIQSPTGEPAIVPFNAFLSASSEAGRRAATEHGEQPTAAPGATSLAPDAIQSVVTGGAATRESTAKPAFNFDVGQSGSDVSAVTLVLEDGTRVSATISQGWFAAWWPGSSTAQTAEITTTNGTTTQRLIP